MWISPSLGGLTGLVLIGPFSRAGGTTIPVKTQRGNIDYDQIRLTARQGTAGLFQMFGGSSTTVNDIVVFDAYGNVTDSGVNIFPAYKAVSADYTALVTDSTIECTANSFTITLPSAVGIKGKPFNIKNSGTGVITVAPVLSQTIDGQLTVAINFQYTNLEIQSNGSNWIIL